MLFKLATRTTRDSSRKVQFIWIETEAIIPEPQSPQTWNSNGIVGRIGQRADKSARRQIVGVDVPITEISN